ncbi:hypothetical protein SAMN05444920_104763 [Nonomuraea solani]|uniref:Uncharacterized protein n=2 Tax=Nonomuraea solani TaxID=1144553 RepID=A0A1H6D4I6_9ACTN|nr:hypothetical protein SAMN05444920_104763 [Nonomuraea solani]
MEVLAKEIPVLAMMTGLEVDLKAFGPRQADGLGTSGAKPSTHPLPPGRSELKRVMHQDEVEPLPGLPHRKMNQRAGRTRGEQPEPADPSRAVLIEVRVQVAVAIDEHGAEQWPSRPNDPELIAPQPRPMNHDRQLHTLILGLKGRLRDIFDQRGRWTVQRLAEAATSSRTAFGRRSTALAGQPPVTEAAAARPQVTVTQTENSDVAPYCAGPTI